jgi:hypothetical protein
MATKFLFKFLIKEGTAAKILNASNNDETAEQSISVWATRYDRAVRKVLKLQIPYVEDETHLIWNNIHEDSAPDIESPSVTA